MTERDFEQESRIRWQLCCRIAEKAQRLGILATPAKVNRNYLAFTRWNEGRLATGYLIKTTGVKVRPREDG
jgi:hypothetical protein